MSKMLDCLRAAISPYFVPLDQKWMRETITIGSTQVDMSCEICAGNNQEFLLCKFDREQENNKNFPYFNCRVDGLVCMCDYVLFVEEAKRLLVLLLELKSTDCPQRQLDVNESFCHFICERLRVIFHDFDLPVYYRKIGIKRSYRPLNTTQGYLLEFNDRYALLPSPQTILLKKVSVAIPME